MSATQSGGVRFVSFDISSATTTHVLAAVSGFSIVVLHVCFSLTGTTPTAKFQDTSGSPNILTGTFDATGVYPFNGSRNDPLFSTAKGKGLDIVTGGTPSMRGFIAYILHDGE